MVLCLKTRESKSQPDLLNTFFYTSENSMYNNEDIKFLTAEFNHAIDEVGQDEFCADLLRRKFAHSARVLQNGLKIINHDIPALSAQPELLLQCQRALLFHDIGRFRETVETYQKQSMKDWGGRVFDHGVIGAEILARTAEYNDIKIVLAVRHHGHLIEEFYADPEYLALSESDKISAAMMVKLVRDSDKLDLYYIQEHFNNIENDVFFHNLTAEQKYASLSSEVLNQFFSAQPINHAFIKTFSDRILGCISWQFDFNYDYTRRLYIIAGYQQMLFDLLAKYCPNKELTAKIREFATADNH